MSCVETIHLVFEGLTAFGTVGAVIISLWLASYSLKIKARGEISFMTFFIQSPTNQDFYSPQEEFVQITITNIGNKSFVINDFKAYDRKEKKYFQAMPDYQHHLCTSPNFVFVETGTGNYVFDLKGFAENFIAPLDLKQHNEKKALIKRLEKLNFYAITNTGNKILVNYNPDFLDEWVELIMNKLAILDSDARNGK